MLLAALLMPHGEFRYYAEEPLSGLASASGVAFDFRCEDPGAVDRCICYFRSGKGWYLVPFVATEKGVSSVRVLKKDVLRTEGAVSGWDKVDLVRISCWRFADGRPGRMEVSNLRPVADEDVVEEPFAPVAALPPKAGEIRAMCCHSPWGLGDRGWDETVRLLKERGITDLWANLCRAGLAYYRSGVLPVSPDVATRGDQFEACRAACRKYGMRMHVWKVMWRVEKPHRTEEFFEACRAAGRFQTHATITNKWWLCPADPVNRKAEIDSFVELARKGPDGILLDYIRYPGEGWCTCDRCRGRSRVETISSLVGEISAAVRVAAPGVSITATVFRDPLDAYDSVGQRWADWCAAGWVDFISPMDYIEDPRVFALRVETQRRFAGKTKILPLIGPTLWKDRAKASARMTEAILATRRLGCDGFGLFDCNADMIRILDGK